MGAVLLVALGVKGVLLVQEWRAWQARRQVMSGLGWYGGTPHFEKAELVAALDDPELRVGVMWGLEQNGWKSPAYVRALVERDRDRNGRRCVRGNAETHGGSTSVL